MRIQKITDIQSYSNLIDRFLLKGTASNNYLLPAEVSRLIYEGKIYSWHDDLNCLFFVEKKGGVVRLYYLLNDLSDKISFNLKLPVVTEILFRGNLGEPKEEISYLQKNGFLINLRRDQYSASIPDGITREPVFAKSSKDTLKVIELFNSTFDVYSGDYIDPGQSETIFENKSLLCSYSENNELQGALEISISGRNTWISHLAVFEKWRGHGVAKKLMEMFFTYARIHSCKRLMLWVQHQNSTALSLYTKYGFKYTNKSTLSLIKL